MEQPVMASLKKICLLYDWKYDTLYKKWKRGEFVTGYKDPAGRGIRFNLSDVSTWAHRNPIQVESPSLVINPV